MQKTLENLAEQAYKELSVEEQRVADQIFIKLTQLAVWQWQRAERQRLISETDNLGNLALSQFQLEPEEPLTYP